LERIKTSHQRGEEAALVRFGLKRANEELRLKIPDRKFHGWDAAHKKVSEGAEKKLANMFGDRRSSEALAELLRSLEEGPSIGSASASKNPLDRSTTWGAPTNPGAGEAAGRHGDMGQGSGFGGV
jgi:hypothetical protein